MNLLMEINIACNKYKNILFSMKSAHPFNNKLYKNEIKQKPLLYDIRHK